MQQTSEELYESDWVLDVYEHYSSSEEDNPEDLTSAIDVDTSLPEVDMGFPPEWLVNVTDNNNKLCTLERVDESDKYLKLSSRAV